VINIKTTDRNGPVVAILSVVETDELMLITQQGMTLRTDLSAVREIGRATQGVRLIKLDEGDKVVAVARLVPEEENGEKGAEGVVDAEGANGSSTDESSDGSGDTTD